MEVSPASRVDVVDAAAVVRQLREFIRFFLRMPGASGQSFTAYGVLSTLVNVGPQRISDLAESERVTQPGMTALVNRLEKEGLVARRPDPTDGRAVLVTATPAAPEALGERDLRRTERFAELLARLDGDERDRLAAALPVLARLVTLDREIEGEGR